MTSTAAPEQAEHTHPGPPRRRPGKLATTLAFLRAEFVEELSYPLSFAFSILRSVLPLLLSFFIAQLVRDERVGGDYLTFVAVGLGVTAMLGGALSGFGASLQRAFQRGTLETYLVEPVPWTFLPFAMNMWQVLLGMFNGTILMVFGSLLGANYELSAIPAFVLLVLIGLLATTAIGILSSAVLMLTLKSQPILLVYGMAASLLAGSVFSVSQLPDWLRFFSYLIPHTYVINGARGLLMADPGSFTIEYSTAMTVLVSFTVIVLPLGVWMFRRTLELARRLGLLSGY
ncbi:MAG TPA: ABC transporter permease [Acidimicrobiia bacterium]|jgi:ABC-2 type transport system permease protein|nr:ABC transporter permease [Acidimicrobiia bacterium]